MKKSCLFAVIAAVALHGEIFNLGEIEVTPEECPSLSTESPFISLTTAISITDDLRRLICRAS